MFGVQEVCVVGVEAGAGAVARTQKGCLRLATSVVQDILDV